jgi:hypothetical protein
MQAASLTPFESSADSELSNFNDSKGIKVLLCCTPLLLPLANGKKDKRMQKQLPKTVFSFYTKTRHSKILLTGP